MSARLQPYPLVRISLAVSIGIIAHEYLWVALLCWSIIGALSPRPMRPALLMALILGSVVSIEPRRERPFSDEPIDAAIVGRVNSLPVVQSEGYRVDVDLPEGAVRLKLKKGGAALLPGDWIRCEGTLKRPWGNRNPGAFHYPTYLEKQGIQWTATADSAYRISAPNIPRVFWPQRWQGQLTQRLCAQALDTLFRSIMPALVLGNRAELQREVRNTFIHSGAIHVLAVSGLHIGMVFLFLRFLLVRAIPESVRHFRLMVLVAGVWAFVVLTGAAPSAVRAGLLCSFVGLAPGRSFHRNGLNLLAGAALLQWAMDPTCWQSVGFQLSYSAVAGILLIAPAFKPRDPSRWRLVRWCADLLRVSVAAQLGTLPFALLYFKVFPLYFWASGFIVLPLAGVLLFGGALILVFSGTEVGLICTRGVEALIGAMVRGLEWLNTLPHHQLAVRNVDILGAILLGGIILAALDWWKRKDFLRSSVLLTLAGLFLANGMALQQRTSERICVHDIFGKVVISVGGQSPRVWSSAPLSQWDREAVTARFSAAWRESGEPVISTDSSAFDLLGKHWHWIGKHTRNVHAEGHVFLVNPGMSPPDWPPPASLETVVLLRGMRHRNTEEWFEWGANRVWNINAQGAWISSE